MFLHLLLIALPAYLLGGVNGAIITSKYVYKKDIRQYGSGNPGLTNFYRVFGKGGVVFVLLIDILKTALPVLFGAWLLGTYHDMRIFGAELAGLCAMLGHAFPVYYKFRGGKTVMAVGTVVFFIDIRVALISWAVFILMVLLTKYVSLGAMLGVSAYPISVALLGLGGAPEIIVAAASAVLLIVRHRANIARLINHTESKFSFSRKGSGQ